MGDFCTDAYLTPKINVAYGDLMLQLIADADSSFQEFVRDVPAVPIGTTDLGIYQASQMPGGNQQGPIFGLYSPITVEWKVAGQPDEEYVEADRVGKIAYVTPASGASPAGSPFNPFTMQWEWRGGIIFVTPLTYPADFRVRAYFCDKALQKDSDRLGIHPLAWIPVSYGTAALIGAERGNATWKEYGDDAQAKTENIENILVKAEQGTTCRIGRTGGRGPYGNGYGGNGR
jgi:hypothetical protein